MTPVEPCVYCRRRPVDPAWRPFCSERCRMADLGRWLGGEYRAPGSGDATAPGVSQGDAERARARRPPL